MNVLDLVLIFHPKGLDYCVGTVQSIAGLEAEEIPAGFQFSYCTWEFSAVRRKFKKIRKTLTSFWMESLACVSLLPFRVLIPSVLT